jgi:hypothetical protein
MKQSLAALNGRFEAGCKKLWVRFHPQLKQWNNLKLPVRNSQSPHPAANAGISGFFSLSPPWLFSRLTY